MGAEIRNPKAEIRKKAEIRRPKAAASSSQARWQNDLARLVSAAEVMAHRSPGDSSVRTGMFIATWHLGTQAPSGAACRPTHRADHLCRS